jgi:hypothetical protein
MSRSRIERRLFDPTVVVIAARVDRSRPPRSRVLGNASEKIVAPIDLVRFTDITRGFGFIRARDRRAAPAAP